MVASDKRRNQSGKGEAAVSNLPQEIIVEILLRLPIKSLCRFRCVSKSWLSVISSPQFAKTHLHISLQNDTLYSQRHRLLFSSFNLYSVEYQSLFDADAGIVAAELDYPLKDKPSGEDDVLLGGSRDNVLVYFKVSEDEDDNPVMVKVDVKSSSNVINAVENWVEIWGSCNGLVCIAPEEDTIFLFNPSTGESKRIPEETLSGPAAGGVNSYGFGYCSISDDYKAVRIGAGSSFSVYSLRNDSWRSIETFPYDSYVYDSGVFLHGALHWVVVSDSEGEDEKYVVLAFDLEDELCRDMPVPSVDDSSDFVAGTLKGCLCVLYSRSDMHDDFWMMRKYGVGESWTRISLSLSYICMKPLCLAKNGEALLEIDGRLVRYNLDENTYKILEIEGMPIGVGFEAATYVESLISPNSYFGREIQI